MGFLNGIMGNASQMSKEKAQKDYGHILATDEEIEVAYLIVRDAIIFTQKRLILVDVQGMTGKKVEYLSIPYRHINRFSVESAGTFDLDADLKLWVSGHGEPIVKKFNKNVSVYEVQAILAQAIANQ